MGGGDVSMKSADNCNDTQKISESSNSEMRDDRDNNHSGNSNTMQEDCICNDSDSSDDDEDDILEIVDLQKALEYLFSERYIEY